MEDKKLYSLHVYNQFDKYWIGTLWYSKLYNTEDSCKEHCLDDEIFDIAAIIGLNYCEFDGLEYPEVIREKYSKNDEDAVQLISATKEWLNGEEGKHFCEEGEACPLLWHIKEFELAPNVTPTHLQHAPVISS